MLDVSLTHIVSALSDTETLVCIYGLAPVTALARIFEEAASQEVMPPRVPEGTKTTTTATTTSTKTIKSGETQWWYVDLSSRGVLETTLS